MEELELQEKPGIFSRLAGMFTRESEDEMEEETTTTDKRSRTYELRSAYKYHVSIRRQIVSFDDALAAAQGFKRGEQQIINLTGTEPTLRQKIVDFMCGVNFAQEGTWEEVGEHIYLVVPASVFVEVAPASPRANAARN
ncbi:MAG TPA: cell division protein SepF [Fimbriimonadaceae bacterium]|nr:cell division protein SepF [Fimbriimonadaceae bacterium]